MLDVVVVVGVVGDVGRVFSVFTGERERETVDEVTGKSEWERGKGGERKIMM